MKVKCTWTAEDIVPGRIVVRDASKSFKRNAVEYLTRAYIIVWTKPSGDCRWSMCSLADGMVVKEYTKEGLAEVFNEDAQGIRPASKKEALSLMEAMYRDRGPNDNMEM